MKSTKLFELTKVFITSGIKAETEKGNLTEEILDKLLEKHTRNKDDNEYEEDRKTNEESIKNGGMVFSTYIVNNIKIYIISYVFDKIADNTTILLPEEY